MAEWNPDLYLKFERDRLRPAADLLARVELDDPGIIVDLGCGPGTSTKLLGEKFDCATVLGIDNSASMIEKARENYSGAEYLLSSIGDWQPDNQVDLIYANAVFHWIEDHPSLIKKLSKSLNPGGVLAFQMPDNLAQPSHRAIDEMLQCEPWQSAFTQHCSPRAEIGSLEKYYQWMAENFDQIDIWRTTYTHILPGHDHIVEWMKGAALTPYLSVLEDDMAEKFISDYTAKIEKAYEAQADGCVLFQFPRLFVIGHKMA